MNILKQKKYLFAIIIILIGGGYYWYKKSHPTASQIRYVTASAEKGTLTTSVSASGNVIVDNSATVDPGITGTVTSLAVSVGDQVKKGQLLFTIDNNDLSLAANKSSAAYQQAQDSLQSAKMDRKQAKADYEAAKQKDNADGNSYTTKQLQIMEDKLKLKDNAISEAQKSADNAYQTYQNDLLDSAKRRVISPIDGTVNAVNVKNGDDLARISGSSNSQAPIIIGDLGTLKAQIQVNEVDVPTVKIGQKATLTFDSLPDFTATGKVEKMDALGTQTQGVVTYNVTLGFDSLDPRIKPGMSVSAAIITDVKNDVITVPNSAVKTQDGSSYVEVMKDGATATTQVSVETGASNDTSTEITSGLSAGDKVVTQTINPTAATSGSSAGSSANRGGGGNVRVPGVGHGFGG